MYSYSSAAYLEGHIKKKNCLFTEILRLLFFSLLHVIYTLHLQTETVVQHALKQNFFVQQNLLKVKKEQFWRSIDSYYYLYVYFLDVPKHLKVYTDKLINFVFGEEDK